MQNNSATFGHFAKGQTSDARQYRTRRSRTARPVNYRSQRDSTPDFLPVVTLAAVIPEYIEARGVGSKPISAATKIKKTQFLAIFERWAVKSGHAQCDKALVIDYFTYLNEKHLQSDECSGSGMTQVEPLTASYKATHFRELRAFFKWTVDNKKCRNLPMRGLEPPKVDVPEIEPLTQTQMKKLFDAAKKSRDKNRNEAILSVLYDSGLRASELCALQVRDIDFEKHTVKVRHGKGNKKRTVHVDRRTTKAIWDYLVEDVEPEDLPNIDVPEKQSIFLSQRGRMAGEPLDANGLGKLIRKLGQVAGIKNVRVSPHTIRHSYAVEYIRNGGDWNALQISLGHNTMAMTQRYVRYNKLDVARHQQKSSPLAALRQSKQNPES